MTNEEALYVISRIRYKDWELRHSLEGGRLFIRWRFSAQCVKTKQTGRVSGRNYRLSQHMTESEIVQTALMAALAAEEHEAREHFEYKGKRVFNPHIDVNKMLEICGFEDGRD